ncbi:urease accessory protein UreE [Ancylobacter mangrovi]|uniref:urease accessory protein UreE n=1 Tax=Ancylobacter mangrovi TaxID=2972472 RepID=UPI002163DF08|nr:urease accessory protein UreE [Ancylobacter mangrovi]MCS0501860.1 urease accessory protein UreE [Ancylobacter mangrovi]
MIHARSLLPAGTWDPATAADRVVLPHDGRHRRRIAMRGEADVAFLLDLPEAMRLKDGDGLSLDDGRTVAVVAAEEPVAEIVATDPHHLARLAWHLGNRHVPAELLADRIRIARDSVLEEMARGLGASVEIVEAAFEPEGGAYEAAEAHGHHHGHEHHAHGEACGCGHDHGDHDHAHHHDHGHDHEHAHTNDEGHKAHAGKHEHAHEHGEACGCGHDHGDHGHGEHDHAKHDHAKHAHDHHAHDDHAHHDHAHHDHGHRHG